MSRQAYYKHDDGLLETLAHESFVVEFIKEIRRKAPGIGGNKLWMMYRRRFGDKHSVGYNRFYDIIERHSLKVCQRKRRTRTTDSTHAFPLYPNLVKDLIPQRPNQVWVSDITYIPFWTDRDKNGYSFCYLSLITDYYTKEIVGWSVGDTLEAKFPKEALRMALSRLPAGVSNSLIHHSDRGVQYACYNYTGLLKSEGVTISMTECGNPKDNAVAERVNNTIKNELLKDMDFFSIKEAREAVRGAVTFYNNERPHMSLDGMTPAEATLCKGEIRKMWCSYREKALKNLMI